MLPIADRAASVLRGFVVWLICVIPSADVQAEFLLAPYLQNVTTDAISVVWWSREHRPGSIAIGLSTADGPVMTSAPTAEPAIEGSPYRHEVRLTDLKPDTRYHYRVRQGDAEWNAALTTAPDTHVAFSFAVAADPESTEAQPERNAIHRGVLKLIARKQPRLLIYSGDLVDEGYPQSNWNALWSDWVQKTPAESFASFVPIYAAPGNHDYCGQHVDSTGKDVPFYSQPYSEAGMARFRAYFSFPANDHPPDDPRRERYYSFRYGPATFIVLDTNNDSISSDDPDINWDTGRHTHTALTGENEPAQAGGQGWAPDIHGGVPGKEDSRQYRWLAETLRQARQSSAFIFVFFHQIPYSSFVHGDPKEMQSGYGLRKLDPLFHKFGVTAVLCGHDEAYERSVTRGENGHEIHYYVLPTCGDPTGLRKPAANPTWQKGYSRFIYPLDRRRFGYALVHIEPRPDGGHTATITPYYYEPQDPDNDRLHYDDVVRIVVPTGM